MSLETVKRIAARLLNSGMNKVRIKEEDVPRAAEALTAEDVRSLIKDKIVYALPKRGVSRARAKVKHTQVKKGRRRGRGSRKGQRYSRVPKKTLWVNKVRTQRALLGELYGKEALDTPARKKLYYMVKGNAFKNKAALMTYLEEHKLLKPAHEAKHETKHDVKHEAK